MLNRRSFVALPVVLAACKGGVPVIDLVGRTMGTTYAIKVVDHNRALTESHVKAAVDTALAETNAALSNWDRGSDVSKFNASASTAPQPVSTSLYEVASAANDVRLASEGRFDIGLGPLIELWGFGANGSAGVTPADADIDAVLAQIGSNRPSLADGKITKAVAENELFLSAIGKGYGVDRVAQALRGLGAEDFMVEIGGDLVTSGRNVDGLPWQIGIETSEVFDRGIQQVVGLKNHGMATSGDYRNYFEADGVRYSHILDATTGRPVTHRTASATVVTENAMLADAWATAMLVLGTVKGLEIAKAHDLAVLFI
ncbi:MAG: FAD:protein FMN transferase, partial [Pseudomonadota bacterium]